MVDLDAQHCNTAATKKKEEQEVYNTNVSSPVLAGLIFFFFYCREGFNIHDWEMDRGMGNSFDP